MATMPTATFYHRWLGWHAPALRQGVVLLGVGAVAGGLGSAFQPWQVAIVGGWDATCVALLVVTWPMIIRADAGATTVLAQRQDPGRFAARAILLAASVASLIGVATVLNLAGHTTDSERVLLISVAVATVVLSWTVVNTIYVLRYAQLRLAQGRDGVSFPDDSTQRQPTLRDFAYVAFTIGMTYQVSDTDVRDPRTRSSVLCHGLLAYLFGVVIVGGSINLIADLLR